MAAEYEPYIEGRAVLNDIHRSRIENGDKPALIRLDAERVRLEAYIRDLGDRLEIVCVRRMNYELRTEVGVRNGDDYRYGDVEFKVEERNLKEKIERSKKWLDDINDRYNRLSQYLEKEEEELREASFYECRKAHYAIVHDLCIRRERKLRWIFWGSAKVCDEKRAKKLLKRIEHLHGNKNFKRNGIRYCGEAMPIAWYWKLAMLVIKYALDKGFVTHVQLAEFSALSKDEKKKARRDKKNFWASAADRLMNLRKSVKDFKLPTSEYTLPITETSYNEVKDDDEDDCSGPVYRPHNLYKTEDDLIEAIDNKRGKARKE